MARTVTLNRVPAAMLAQVTKDFQDAGATVTSVQQPDGTYTVTAAFP